MGQQVVFKNKSRGSIDLFKRLLVVFNFYDRFVENERDDLVKII